MGKEKDFITMSDLGNHIECPFCQQKDAKIADLEAKLAEKDLRIEELESQFAYECECNKQFVECQNENEKLKQQLALTEKALKLAREYMFNVMCADDVPFESWFIECAKNDWKPS